MPSPLAPLTLSQGLWLLIIDKMIEQNLCDKKILDFGCGRGGFLRVLHDKKPFKKGIGIDIDSQLINMANTIIENQPITYEHRKDIEHLHEDIDIAFNHEVFYFLNNLHKHARQIFAALKSGGVYYVVLGCHSDNPLWQKWKEMIEQNSNVKLQSYSLNYIVEVFKQNGFSVSGQKYMLNQFISLEEDTEYFPNITDRLNYYWDYKLLFKFAKNNTLDAIY